jgi:UDP-glucose 4-epimerase
MKSISLRYFNAAGATLNGELGESHNPETHLIPNLIKAALGNGEFNLFGDNYNTPDGTCIRDYVHVLDLAEAHILALEHLNKKNICTAYNVGSGKGYSNKELIDTVKKVSGKNFKVNILPRRAGDADRLFADSTKIRKELGWKPKYSDIKTIIKSAWEWHKNHPNGFYH